MDYIYGKLNNKVKSVEYNGINSDTTNITVDNSDREHRTIKVDVIKTPGTLTINNTNGESVSFNGSIDENLTIDSPTTEQYQDLVTKVNDLENNKVDKGQPGSKWQLYGIGSKTTPLPNGNTISTAEQALPMTVINRNTDGRAEIATPINPLDIVNKQYADDGDENLAKVMPTDINVDSEHNLILEHDGTELAGQKKQVVVPPVTYTVSPVAYDKIFSFDGNSTYILGHNFLVGDLDIDNTMQVQKGIYLSSVTQPILGIYNSSNIYTTYSTGTGGEAYINTYNPDFKKQTYTFAPNKSGIVAVMTDLDTRVKKTGDTMSGDLTLVHSNLNIVSWPIANSKITFSTFPGTTPLYHISYDTTNERLEFAYESGSIAKLQYTSDCFILTSEGGKITGNLTIQGNLSVSGTTTTVDTETLKVKDNVIVTNSDKKKLIDLSGLAINTDATNTFGIMYNPTSNTVDLGLGTITTEGKFTFNENEGLPLAIRDSNSSFTQDHLISWSTDKNKLTDSGIDKSKVKDLTDNITYDKNTSKVQVGTDLHVTNSAQIDGNIEAAGLNIVYDAKFHSSITALGGLQTYNGTSIEMYKGDTSTYELISIQPQFYDDIPNLEFGIFTNDYAYRVKLNLNDNANILTDKNASTYLTNYAKLDSSNSFNNLQTFSEVKVNSYLDINYPDIDIIRISENANGQLQFDFSRVGGGTTVLPSGSANNTATIITTDNIAANVANKLDKVTSQGGYRVYAISGAGSQGTVDYSPSSTGSTIMSRDAQGKAQVATPTASDSVKSIANVEYVKNYVKNNSSKLTVTDNEDGTLTLSF